MITVRAARPSEYQRVGALTIDAYRALPVDHLWGGYDEQILATKKRAKHAEIIVAVDDLDEVVGSVTYAADAASEWSEWTRPHEAQFRLLAVDPVARRQGVGDALVRACINRAGRDEQPILIHTTPWMIGAQRIYARHGFTWAPERDVPYDEWHRDRDLVLPDEWIGQPFLAYSWTPPT